MAGYPFGSDPPYGLRRLSGRYRPYVDAIEGTPSKYVDAMLAMTPIVMAVRDIEHGERPDFFRPDGRSLSR
jgi:hypothetical protein